MSFPNSNNSNRIRKNSSSDSSMVGNMFDISSNKNNSSKNEKFEDSEDDLDKKFGSNSNKGIRNEKNDEEEESSEEEDYELKVTEEISFDKKKDKKAQKKEKEKEKKKKKNNKKIKEELSDDNERMSLEYSSSDTFIKNKYPKKKNKKEKNKEKHKEKRYKEKNNKNNKIIGPSRFKTDFKIIKKLGQGGEGAVFEVMNLWDRQHYAIKRMKIKVNEEEGLNEVTDNVKKEVYFLSRNRCSHIVRYYQTWEEDYNKDDFKDESDNEDFDESNSTIKRKSSFEGKSRTALDNNEINSKFCYASDGIIDDNSSDEEESQDDKDEKESSDEENEEKEHKGLGIWDDDDDDNESDEDSRKKKKKKKNNNLFSKKKYNKKKEKIKVLYIQMELCENNTLRHAIDQDKIKSNELKWELISQVLEGVKYIHDNGYIHRDLKPGNIFLDKDNYVKIGDFGLVQKLDKNKKGANNNQFNTFFNYNSLQYVNFGGDLLTVGIGTKYYCSPEQEKSENYDNKTDIYSLGIIIFEMFYKFNSLMERDITLRGIKEEQIYPKDMEKKCGKNVATIVKNCTNIKPELRPSIKDLIKSKLIPSHSDKQIIINEFKKDFLEKNINLTNEFLNILIERKKKAFVDYNKNIKNNPNHEDNLNESRNTGKKGKKKDLSENDILNVDDDFYSFLFPPLNKLLDLNPSQNSYDSSIFTLSVFEKLRFQMQQILNNYNAFYYRLSEFELYNKYNEFCYYNSNKQKFCKLYLKENKNECAITQNGVLLSKSSNMYNNLNQMISMVYNSRFYNSFFPITFYYDSSGAMYNTNPFNNIKEYIEYNDIICSSLWKESDNLFDYDSKYIINNLRIILNILNEFGFISKNIEIKINSSIILDVIYDHFLKKKYKEENLEETKIKTLLTISSLLNKRDYQYNIHDLTKLLKEKNIINEMPIQIDELIELINYYYNEKNKEKHQQNLENSEEREKRINEENLINSYFDDLYWESNYNYLLKYKNKVFLDYTLIPENLKFYSGFFLQVRYKRDKIVLPLIEGGIIDNYLFDKEKSDEQIKGFSFIVYMDNIFEIKIRALSILNKQRSTNFLFDCLIIRTHEDVQIKLLNDLGKTCLEEKLKYQIIYKPQDKNIDFEKYYSLYRMKQLISINLVEIEEKKEEKEEKEEKEKFKFKKEKRKERWKEKKEKEKEKEKKEKEEKEKGKEKGKDELEEKIEVNYSCFIWDKNGVKSLKNLNLQEIKNNFKIFFKISNT